MENIEFNVSDAFRKICKIDLINFNKESLKHIIYPFQIMEFKDKSLDPFIFCNLNLIQIVEPNYTIELLIENIKDSLSLIIPKENQEITLDSNESAVTCRCSDFNSLVVLALIMNINYFDDEFLVKYVNTQLEDDYKKATSNKY